MRKGIDFLFFRPRPKVPASEKKSYSNDDDEPILKRSGGLLQDAR